jgi:hypothetical protein
VGVDMIQLIIFSLLVIFIVFFYVSIKKYIKLNRVFDNLTDVKSENVEIDCEVEIEFEKNKVKNRKKMLNIMRGSYDESTK